MSFWGTLFPDYPKSVNQIKVIVSQQMGNYLIVQVRVRQRLKTDIFRVLVYEGVEKVSNKLSFTLKNVGDRRSPIAEFAGTNNGWVYAQKLCSILNNQRLQLEF